MRMDEFIGKDWVNITPLIHPCMSNMGDGTEWQINLSLYTDTEEKKAVGGGGVGEVTGNGIILRKDHPNYMFRLIKTVLDDVSEHSLSDSAFIIMAKKKSPT